MEIITVNNEKITRLQYEAQGFRNAFYILYNSVMSKDGCESWAQDGDGMSVLGTNGCFAVELYLKFLMVIDSFDASTLSGTHPKGHSLDFLYDQLKVQNATVIAELESEYSESKYKHDKTSLKDFLTSIRDYFIDWRYSYDSGVLNVNLNTLSDVLNMLEDYSKKKFLAISEELAKHPVSTSDGQTMTISDFDDIRKL